MPDITVTQSVAQGDQVSVRYPCGAAGEEGNRPDTDKDRMAAEEERHADREANRVAYDVKGNAVQFYDDCPVDHPLSDPPLYGVPLFKGWVSGRTCESGAASACCHAMSVLRVTICVACASTTSYYSSTSG